MQHNRLVSALLLMLAADIVQAAEQSEADSAAAEEFMLFLADWDDGQGNWQDPLDYSDLHWAELDSPDVKIQQVEK